MKILKKYIIIMLLLIIFISLVIISVLFSKLTVPQNIDSIDSKRFTGFIDYYSGVYHNGLDIKCLGPLVKRDASGILIKDSLRLHNFFWDVAPDIIKREYPLSSNLSVKWPPGMGERYKLTAYPYPKSKSIIVGIYQLISNTADTATFPGWFISRYNPYDPHENIYSNFFHNNQWIEVTHACYPPPTLKYPTCDDGGWWAYLTVGSGVFWNTGNKCLVARNKLHALTLLGLSIDDISDSLKGKGGGLSIISALTKVIDSLEHSKKPKAIVGFRSMKPQDTGSDAWTIWITSTVILIYLLIIYFIKSKSVKSLIIGIVLAISMYYFWYYVLTEQFIRGFGWMTLDMGLKETGMNLKEFVTECVTGNLKNGICNGLAMTQMFDLQLESRAFAMGYSSFVLTTQPNKSGSWAVEICDLSNYTSDKSGKIINLKLGICGEKKGELKFKQGPIECSIYKPYYKPTKECICDESTLERCVSCKNSLSNQMCSYSVNKI
jgi:hypothetical protein